MESKKDEAIEAKENESIETYVKAESVPAASSQHPKVETFWTVCDKCKICYEFHKTWLNHNLICPPCQQSFLAVEIPEPPVPAVRPPRERKRRRKDDQNAAKGCPVSKSKKNATEGSQAAAECLVAKSEENATEGIQGTSGCPVAKGEENAESSHDIASK